MKSSDLDTGEGSHVFRLLFSHAFNKHETTKISHKLVVAVTDEVILRIIILWYSSIKIYDDSIKYNDFEQSE